MPQTGYCTDVTCLKELTELYECHCCSWMICLKHLLEHVEIAKRDKKQQIESLKNQLQTISSTLEVIVDKKVQEIEREKQLLDQAKTIFNKSAHTMEEIEILSEDINQAIVANRKEETIVKVEPVLSEMKISFSNDQLMIDAFEPPAISSSLSNYILQQPPSPVYRPVILRSVVNDINQFARSSTPKPMFNQSSDISHGFNSSGNSTNKENTGTEILENSEGRLSESNSKSGFQCPLTFDSAFVSSFFHRSLQSHITQVHCLKMSSAKRICAALKEGQDPKTTLLFDDNEEIIDPGYYLPCPLSNSAIHLIGHCPTDSRFVPCQCGTIRKSSISSHLHTHHRIPSSKAKSITKIYHRKLAKGNHA